MFFASCLSVLGYIHPTEPLYFNHNTENTNELINSQVIHWMNSTVNNVSNGSSVNGNNFNNNNNSKLSKQQREIPSKYDPFLLTEEELNEIRQANHSLFLGNLFSPDFCHANKSAVSTAFGKGKINTNVALSQTAKRTARLAYLEHWSELVLNSFNAKLAGRLLENLSDNHSLIASGDTSNVDCKIETASNAAANIGPSNNESKVEDSKPINNNNSIGTKNVESSPAVAANKSAAKVSGISPPNSTPVANASSLIEPEPAGEKPASKGRRFPVLGWLFGCSSSKN